MAHIELRIEADSADDLLVTLSDITDALNPRRLEMPAIAEMAAADELFGDEDDEEAERPTARATEDAGPQPIKEAKADPPKKRRGRPPGPAKAKTSDDSAKTSGTSPEPQSKTSVSEGAKALGVGDVFSNQIKELAAAVAAEQADPFADPTATAGAPAAASEPATSDSAIGVSGDTLAAISSPPAPADPSPGGVSAADVQAAAYAYMARTSALATQQVLMMFKDANGAQVRQVKALLPRDYEAAIAKLSA